MTIEPVTIWRRVALPDGRERIVAVDAAGKTVHVALMTAGTDSAVSEISFELKEAFDLAAACLAGNSRAMTTAGLTRLLCASVLVLGVAAFKANGILAQVELPHEPGEPDGGDCGDRSEADGDGPDSC